MINNRSQTKTFSETRWDLIVQYYDMLLLVNPSPLVELNRAIALGMLSGPREALDITDKLLKDGALSDYPLLYATRADFLKKLGQTDQAIKAYNMALDRTQQQPQRRYLEKQLSEILK